ncbi:AAA-associated domain-containing protein [Acidianus manzaensis]|uniref:ABC transporter ATP-binding protein n=1 Tax=Acidianus manzaensis TaxID=282676 RepID=A0A1W6JXT8_9CREN|nr:AAA-associated domain-containing protein [Acidianus manzaensis]ARM75069.1 ABC transporter ATP-binding protein [Acidianus manzaensis]
MNIIDPQARIADLLGLLTILQNSYEGKTDLYKLEKDMEVDLDDLMPIVYTANYLGFVTVGGGDIIITDKGIEFLNANIRKRKELLRDSLRKTEPFITAMELKTFSLNDLKEALEKKGIYIYASPEGIYDLQMTITEWGVYSGLISRDEDDLYKVNYDKS